MNIERILTELRVELSQVTEAILALERMEAEKKHRRGRPPRWLTEAKQAKKRNE
jgi:hypothetical protein